MMHMSQISMYRIQISMYRLQVMSVMTLRLFDDGVASPDDVRSRLSILGEATNSVSPTNVYSH